MLGENQIKSQDIVVIGRCGIDIILIPTMKPLSD